MYVKPKVNVLNTIKSNNDLFKYLRELQDFKKYDEYNYNKFNINIQIFFSIYLKIHDINVNKKTFIKLKKYKSKCMKYLNRIPFRIENDLILSQKLYNIIYNINRILESFLFNSSVKLNVFYNSAYNL